MSNDKSLNGRELRSRQLPLLNLLPPLAQRSDGAEIRATHRMERRVRIVHAIAFLDGHELEATEHFLNAMLLRPAKRS